MNNHNFVIQFFGPTEQPLPPSLKHLTAFIAHCYIKGLAASTTRTFISSLSFIFQLGSYQDISQTFLIKELLKGFHKSKPTTDPLANHSRNFKLTVAFFGTHNLFLFYQTAS